jgi:SAM-dependent methyltransferase
MAPGSIPDHVRWAVDLLAPDAHDRVLEVGSGPGAAVELVCDVLDGGSMVAVDRSPVAVHRIAERAATHRWSGRLRVVHSGLADLTVEAGSFDLAFTLDVNTFWTGPATAELAVLRDALRPGGRLAILYGPGLSSRGAPGDVQRPSRLRQVEVAVAAAGFERLRTVRTARGSGVLADR